jgi:filamentous hemagglutinin family protein
LVGTAGTGTMARRRDRGLLLGLAVGAMLLWPLASSAEVATDGTLGAEVRLTGRDAKIPARLGQIRGQNLFHSFERFGVDTGGKVTFTGPDGLKNVISRVTGGERSTIDGTLASRIPGADVWLLNPAGILFGPHARLDVPGSFHASTADELRFEDGKVFSALDPGGSVLSVAPPQAFGFLGVRPAAIDVDRSVLEVKKGKALSLVGGDITIQGSDDTTPYRDGLGREPGTVRARAGRIDLMAPGGSSAVPVEMGQATGALTGTIRLTDKATVVTNDDDGGTIRIRGGRLVVEGASVVFADNLGASHATGGVAIEAGEVMVTDDGSAITADAYRTGNAGRVTVAADAIELHDGGDISSSTVGPGDGGEVLVRANRVTIANGGAVETNSAGTGRAGDVFVQAQHLITVRNGGLIGSSGTGSAPAGDVRLEADILQVEDASIRTVGIGNLGGAIALRASDLIHLSDAEVTSSGAQPGTFFSLVALEASRIAVDASLVASLTGTGEPLPGSGVGVFGDITVISADSLVGAFSTIATEQLVTPQSMLLDAGNLLRESCGARRTGKASSFTAMGRGGLPPDPGGPLAGAYREPGSTTVAGQAGPVLAASFGDGCKAAPGG